MENINIRYIPVGHATKVNYKALKIKRFIKNNKVKLLILGIFLSFIISDILLVSRFIKILAIL